MRNSENYFLFCFNFFIRLQYIENITIFQINIKKLIHNSKQIFLYEKINSFFRNTMSNSQTFGMKLSILSFDLPINLVKESDDIRVSITTMPEQHKQAFIIPAKKMKNPYLNYKFNIKLPSEYLPKDFITTGTEKILVIFRKKSYFNSDPIIAFASIPVKEFPKDLSNPIQMKTINLYKNSTCNCNNSKNNNKTEEKNEPKIVGKMNIQMTLRKQYQLKEIESDEQFLDFNDNSIKESKFTLGRKFFGFQKL